MAGDNEGPASSQIEGGDVNERHKRLQQSLPKLATTFSWDSWRPKFMKRNKTTDAVTKVKQSETQPPQRLVQVQRHDCRAAVAGCVAGPSTVRHRPNHRDYGRPSYTTPNGVSPSGTTPYTSAGLGSAPTSNRSISSWTQATTPDHVLLSDTFVPRSGVIPSVSSVGISEHATARYSTTYSPRTSDSSAAEAVRVRSEGLQHGRSFELDRRARYHVQAKSHPSSSVHRSSLSSAWRSAFSSKPEKGKAKAREYMEDIDGKMSKRARSKRFSKPPVPLSPYQMNLFDEEMPPVLTDPGYDNWTEMPLLQKKKVSARVNSDLSKYNWSAAVGRKQQPPVVEPVGPSGEDRFGVQTPDTSVHELGDRIHHINLGVSSSRVTAAAMPAAVSEDGNESDNYPSPSSSGYRLSGDEWSYDEQTHKTSAHRRKPRDSAQPRQLRNGSVDFETLNSKHVKAAGYEKICYSKSKSKWRPKSKTKQGQGQERCDGENGNKQKLEMWRMNSKAGLREGEAEFVMCESPQEIDRGSCPF